MNTLLIIDPQFDFCDPEGALTVPNGMADIERLSAFIEQNAQHLDAVVVSLDTHHPFDIAHPGFWRDAQGNPPAPFTTITAADVEQKRFQGLNEEATQHALMYLKALENQGCSHTIWPEHCILGTPGHALPAVLSRALAAWEFAHTKTVTFVLKGQYPWTEHFSVLRAEVPDEGSPSTLLNQGLLDRLNEADKLYVAGEASSHCVRRTVEDLRTYSPEIVPKIVILEDAMSPVQGCEQIAAQFLDDCRWCGMKLAHCSDAIA